MEVNERDPQRPLSAIAESNTHESKLQSTGIINTTDQEKTAQEADPELAGGTLGTAAGEQIPMEVLAANGYAPEVPPANTYPIEPPPGSYPTTRVGSRMFLSITGLLSAIAWLISFISQVVVSAKVDPAPVRILWFPLILQLILIALIVEVIIGSASYNAAYAYGTQISIFASLITAISVLGIDRNLHPPTSPSQSAVAASWLIATIINILWIAYFTSPPNSPFIILGAKIQNARLSQKTQHMIARGEIVRPPPVERIEKSTDAFPTSAHNLLKKPNRLSQRYSTATSTGPPPRRPQHGIMPSEDYTLAEGQRNTVVSSERGTFGARNSSAGVAGLGSGGGSGRGSKPAADDQGSVRPSSGTNTDAPSVVGLGNVRTGVGRVSMAPPTIAEMTPVASSTPLMRMGGEEEFGVKWKAEALFEYNANPSDLNEISFKKGEILGIVDKSGKWWEARGSDGRVGIFAFNDDLTFHPTTDDSRQLPTSIYLHVLEHSYPPRPGILFSLVSFPSVLGVDSIQLLHIFFTTEILATPAILCANRSFHSFSANNLILSPINPGFLVDRASASPGRVLARAITNCFVAGNRRVSFSMHRISLTRPIPTFGFSVAFPRIHVFSIFDNTHILRLTQRLPARLSPP
ncbi:hypothetical protein CVT24_004702 [Panaeolus cyanescens]|uniref:SH3 domain-containing protein n=1 Tax=Panaeolus cyanescens TaxID=181874 RepID=A0A409YSQ5_9AGAR|nr:hypothetical protein CVT24_004702 [Panaeolus cyanescens]